jgi:hypothetical protein
MNAAQPLSPTSVTYSWAPVTYSPGSSIPVSQIASPPHRGGPTGSSSSATPQPIVPPSDTHHRAMVWVAMLASMICAAGAGFGLVTGLLSPADGALAGYAVPIIAGIVLAVATGAGWHMLQTAAPRVRTPLGVTGTIAAAFLLAAITIGASSWGVASSLSGPAAVRAYLAGVLIEYRQAFVDAWTGAEREASVIDTTVTAANEMRSLAAMETNGDISTVKGNGPNTRLLQAAGDRYDDIAAQMRTDFEHAKKLHERGGKLLQAMQQARRSHPETFADRADELAAVIADLNAFRIASQARQGGISRVEINFDPNAVRRIRSGTDKVTAKLLAVVSDVEARSAAPVPAYIPIEPRDATLRYATTAAIGGWVSAIAIDLAPLLMTLCLFVTAREELLLRHKSHTPTTNHPD